MARVICNLPNASELINGVKFVLHKGEMISEEIAEDVANVFASIRGYRLAGAKKAEKQPDAPPPETKKPDQEPKPAPDQK